MYRPGSKLKTLCYMAYFMNKYYDKVAKDERLDGDRGHTTNSTLSDDRIIEEIGASAHQGAA